MTIELTVSIIISIISVSFAIYSGLKSGKRADTKDIEERTIALTRTNVMLEHISKTMGEIKEQIFSISAKVDLHSERIIKTEEGLATAWRRIDEQRERISKTEELISYVMEKISSIEEKVR